MFRSVVPISQKIISLSNKFAYISKVAFKPSTSSYKQFSTSSWIERLFAVPKSFGPFQSRGLKLAEKNSKTGSKEVTDSSANKSTKKKTKQVAVPELQVAGIYEEHENFTATTGMSNIELLERQIKLIELIIFLKNDDIEWPTIMSDLLNKGYSKQECSIYRYCSKENLLLMLLSKEDLSVKKQDLLIKEKDLLTKEKDLQIKKQEERNLLLLRESSKPSTGKINLSIYVINNSTDALF